LPQSANPRELPDDAAFMSRKHEQDDHQCDAAHDKYGSREPHGRASRPGQRQQQQGHQQEQHVSRKIGRQIHDDSGHDSRFRHASVFEVLGDGSSAADTRRRQRLIYEQLCKAQPKGVGAR
jgi:hypothetical protein